MTMAEELPSVPTLPAGSEQLIRDVVDLFINQIWFPFVATTGDSGELSTAISNQTVAPTDFSKVNPLAQMSAQYAGLWTTPTATIAGTINNIWACIQDLRDAPTVRTVTGLDTDNTDPENPIVKIAVGAGITGLGTPASPLLNAGVTKIIAGSNVTITPAGGTGDVTIDASGGVGSFTHYIGELYGGGIIFALWKNAGVEHGLILSLTTIGNLLPWTLPAYDSILVPAGGATSRYDGATNTAQIVAQAGPSLSYAAGLCDAYSDGVFFDWYLPAAWELNLCFTNAAILNKVLFIPIYHTTYWTSSQFAIAAAHSISFITGDIDVNAKSDLNDVRAIREF